MQPSNDSNPLIDQYQAEIFSLDPNDPANLDRIKMLNCKIAGLALFKELELKGVELTGVGVSWDIEPQIRINLLNKKGKKLVPKEFNGYKVEVCITGKIFLL